MTKDKYSPSQIESKWQKAWEKARLFYDVDQDPKKKKFYALVEFPYPSGEGLHLGHTFTNTILDVFARKKRMEGFNVLHPMGWDAFGLPTENYAIRSGIPPAKVTAQNTARFRQQDKRLGFSYTWAKEINTTDPNYYKWTQWIFIQLFKHGLAYKAEAPVGWCPACKIILANEEIVGGKCERCGATAEYRKQKQWLLRITAYADRLADELDLVDYPDYVKASQRNWIGRSVGVEEFWQVAGLDLKLSTFTTWLHTSWGATFIVIAPEHQVISQLVAGTKYEQGAKKFCQEIISQKLRDPISIEKEKKGFFTGRYAINHLTGEKMKIFIANFVVMEYGTGIVKGCPAHDKRDFDFAQKFSLPIRAVISPKKGIAKKDIKLPYIGEGVMINAGKFTGMETEKAREEISKYVIAAGNGKRAVHYHLRDWIFSRQHYWGEPIPMVYCQKCAKKGIIAAHLRGVLDSTPWESAGWFPVPEDQLPVELPRVEKYQPTDTGESPLANIRDWLEVACPECGGAARRETDTMPNWAGSSWYYLAYPIADKLKDSKLQSIFAQNKNALAYWLPVDLYLGGAEHTTLHLLYSRFWHKFLNDIGAAPGKEPYAARRQHGVILGPDGYRMSKSRGNIVNPEDIVNKYGADTLRMYLLFMGPYDSTMPWSDEGVEGIWRFLNRVWRIYQQDGSKISSGQTTLSRLLHQTIKKVGEDIDNLKHNTAIAALMEFLNAWSDGGALTRQDAGLYLRLLAPFAPFLAEELWQKLRELYSANTSEVPRSGTGWRSNDFDSSEVKWASVHLQSWPQYDPKLAQEERVTIVIQVNSRVRGQLTISNQQSTIQSEVEDQAKKDEKVAKYLSGQTVRKTIFIPGKLINFVI